MDPHLPLIPAPRGNAYSTTSSIYPSGANYAPPPSLYVAPPATATAFSLDSGLEKLLSAGPSTAESDDPTLGLLRDRSHTTRLSLDDALQQIRGRLAIYTANLADIEQAKCAAINADFTFFRPQGGGPDAFSPELHQALQDLYRQQREERTNLWQALSRIRERVPEALRAYLVELRRLELLHDDRGDGA